MRRNHKRPLTERGFSLIELMIVIAIIGILVGVGIPAYRAITRSGNEAAAIKTLQTLAVNERLYYKQKQGNAYGTFDQLVATTDLDKRFVGDEPVVSGYIFKITLKEKATGQPPFYSINANPQQPGNTGTNYYYVDANSDTVKVNDQQPAGPDDPPVSQ
ncbi:MAG: prepilin-type N-terminal cleavage/methylation domain-containing protein [Acidobacteria bacterium]|nr:prepilin-type N-terminal cleavage/methylation domain-containing protein [Acidobacteriota bacterium]